MSLLSSSRAESLLEAVRGRRLLVLGDLMLDAYIMGQVSRISPEAPVPVVRVARESHRLGGAGNVAANALPLGAVPRLIGLIGADAAADAFRAELTRSGLDGASLVVDATRPTSVKTRVVAHNQQVVRYDREDDRDAAPEIETRIIDAFLEGLSDADAVVVSDYAKGTLTRRVLKETLAAAQTRGIPVVVDPSVRAFSCYEPISALTPNHHEAAQAAQVFGHDDEAVLLMGRRILERLDTSAVVITRGESGMTIMCRDGKTTHIPTVAREVYDVTGAGDTVSTVFTLVLAAGGSALEAAVLSNHAAGVVVGKIGTATASPAEILASLNSR